VAVKAGSNGAAPFVGRAAELGLLKELAREAGAGQPRLVLVEGEPGAGKSALLATFLAGLAGAYVLRASGDESEELLAYGVVAQLLACPPHCGEPAAERPEPPAAQEDPLVVGAGLISALGQPRPAAKLTVVAVDDLHWSDGPSAAALLFAARRLHAGRLLAVMTARPGQLARLGQGWARFVAGDYRATRIRLGGLTAAEIAELGPALRAGEVPHRAAARLAACTGGNPLYCRMLLEESPASDRQEWERGAGWPPVPPALAATLLAGVHRLSEQAQRLLAAAAVLGQTASLATAAALAELADPVTALDEVVQAGLAMHEQRPDGGWLSYAHPLLRRAVYDSLRPAARRGMHQRAAELLDPQAALAHRFAAVIGSEAALASDLAEAGRSAAAAGRLPQAASLLAQASAVSPDAADSGRLLLDALEALIDCGDAGLAQALATRVAPLPGTPRKSLLLGQLDLLDGRVDSARERLARAWQDHDPATQTALGTRAATQLAACCLHSARLAESLRWGERALRAAGELRPDALSALALSLAYAGRGGDGLAKLDFLPPAPAQVPPGLTGVLIVRGMVRAMAGDASGAAADLSVAAGRLRDGAPARYESRCLSHLAEAEYRLGHWDDAAGHGQLAVSAARDAGRRGDFSLAHAAAALVPAARGDWEAASAHVAQAGAAARTAGTPLAVTAWASARAALAAARGDHEEVLSAAAAARAAGGDRLHHGWLALDGWRPLEVAALTGTGELAAAAGALSALRASLTPASPRCARVITQWLAGSLAAERGDAVGAEHAFAGAWRDAGGLGFPFLLAMLELADGRRLRQAGRRPEAIARLRRARGRLSALAADPYLAACDAGLSSCGVAVGVGTQPPTLGLTPGELAVARLVAQGRSNREAAAELYVSVKAVEFHLGNVFTKLGIHSRRALAEQFGASLAGHPQAAPEMARVAR
jgi:DNA-binding CsgD family transcriptional regulator